MTEHERTEREQPETDRPKVKVTDKRRVRADEAAPAAAGAASGPAAGSGAPIQSASAETTRDEVAEYREHLQRLQAEFSNYRKRVLREQTQAIEMAAEPLVRKLLEVLDEFDLALIAAEQKPDFERFRRGVELVYAKLQEALKSEGLERIEADGKPFDPEQHEALMGTSGGEGDPVVADVFRQGYRLRGRVIRPAGVRVAHRDRDRGETGGPGGSSSEREGASDSPQNEIGGSGGSSSEREGASDSPQNE